MNRRSPLFRYQMLACFGLLILALAGCRSVPMSNSGQILLWHSWEDAEEAALLAAIERFEVVFPDTNVIAVFVPEAELLSRYQSAAETGLGPDLFFGPSDWLRPLAEAELLQTLPEDLERSPDYLSGALTSSRYGGALFAIPFSVEPLALYYNRSLIETPAETLDEILDQSEAGIGVGINTRFEDSLWGAQGFGGQLFDESGAIVIDDGGFANWFNWLKSAQETNGIVFSRDDATLQTLFLEERIAYVVAGPRFLQEAREEMGGDAVGVTKLPRGPIDEAGPLLNPQLIMLNASSTEDATERALQLARFLTNTEQSATFVREIGLVPANRQARVDNRAFPALSAFSTQSRTSIAIPNFEQADPLIAEGDSILLRVLEGVIDPNEAMIALAAEINEEFGLEMVVDDTELCILQGELVIWTTWETEGLAWLNEMISETLSRCPDISIQLVRLSSVNQLTLSELIDQRRLPSPHLILAEHTTLFDLANREKIDPISVDLLPRFLPAAQDAVKLNDGTPYGIPISVDVPVMMYNASLVDDPAVFIEDLIIEAESGRDVGIMVDFESVHWGASLFGNGLFPEGAYQFSESGLREWLNWLQVANLRESVRIGVESDAVIDAFGQGELAYLIGWGSEIGRVQSTVSDETLQVAQLPDSLDRTVVPVLRAEVIMITSGLSDEEQAIAFEFANAMTDPAVQSSMASRLGWIPAVTAADSELLPFFQTLVDQAAAAQPLPNNEAADRARTAGPELIQTVIRGGWIEPALTEFDDFVRLGVDQGRFDQIENREIDN